MGLYGTIPSKIGNSSFLAFLSIRNNSFYGSLPKELAHLLHLEHLDFGFNFFNGSIPPSIASLPKLRSLLLEANNFVENFALSLCDISSLQRINISRNRLSGFIYFSASSLEVIDLSYNGLSGEIPADLFNYPPKLQVLYLSRNQLNDTIFLVIVQYGFDLFALNCHRLCIRWFINSIVPHELISYALLNPVLRLSSLRF